MGCGAKRFLCCPLGLVDLRALTSGLAPAARCAIEGENAARRYGLESRA
jgi:hypothetical protein